MNTIPVKVVSATSEATDVRLLRLSSLDGSLLPGFQPGAHIDLHLGPALVRQYSLCGPLNDTSSYSVAVKREAESRGGSKAVHEQLEAGSHLRISSPRSNFPMAHDATHSILVAGGIGITPLISMARALLASDKSFELAYFCRSADHAAFRAELESGPLAPSTRLLLGLDREAVERTLKAALGTRTAGAHLYLCGPRPFMDLVRQVARENWPDDAVHLEYFVAEQRDAPAVDTRFQVALARRGITVSVECSTTIVDALRAHGIDIETSCEQGVCGTCVTDVLEGSPDHRDSFLTTTEKAKGNCMALCVSRSLSPLLVLDL